MKQALPRLLSLLVCALAPVARAQTTLPALPLPQSSDTQVASPLTISQQAIPSKPLSVVGPRGTLLGEQDGKYEAWVFPWKIFSGMRLTANMDNYAIPIDVNDHAAWIDVQPDRTTITYSHANFTIRQIMMAPRNSPDGTGALVFYQVQATRPLTLTFSFDPVMQRMWPAASDDLPSPEWVPTADGSGFYILHENFPDHAAAISMPLAHSGILPPYQERAHAWPLQFVLHVDPAKDPRATFPLLITLANTAEQATRSALAKSLLDLDTSAQSIAAANTLYFRDFSAQHASIDTPDASLNKAFSWAEIAIDQLRVQTTPGHHEEAFTAGFVGSGNAARPGFGWFFGRDALWSLYAVNSYGDFDASRKELDFLLHRQRSNGEIMHEWSQTADLVDWKSLPYEYAAADATPLLPMVMNDYLNISGDKPYILAHWDQLQLAWNYETSHDSADGIYNNTSGSGWVESWVPSMPHQEIYLAVLDEQASLAFAQLARSTGHTNLADQATQRAATLRTHIESEYYLPKTGFYAFSHNADGTTDNTATIFPTVAWWDGTYALDHPKQMFPRWSSSEFSTDWGTRLLSDRTSFYDPISYHQGTVWPLFTGWASVAEYRSGHPLAGYVHLMQNANLTWAQDPGSVTELLSGQFYQVLGRSTAHQLWSSAMVISPVLRGLFGLEWDASHHTLTVTPHLPADWNQATLHQLPFADGHLTLTLERHGQELTVAASGNAARNLALRSRAPGAALDHDTLHIPLPPVEVAVAQHLPPFGNETGQLKILNEEQSAHHLTLTLAAQGSSRQTLQLRENAANLDVHAGDATLGDRTNGLRTMTVTFPSGEGYVTSTVQISW